MKILKISLEGKTYEVGVELLESHDVTSKATAVAPEIKGLRVVSPMAGLILNLRIKVGDSVREGQELLVLEAMKMETSVNAPKAGKVLAILVEKGASVNEDQVLLTLES